MLFISSEFIFFFLPFCFFTYFFLLQKRLILGAKCFLVFASLFFYSWWDVRYLPIILSSILINYVIGNSLNENISNIRIKKKALLAIGIFTNITILSYFKYSDFFIENINLFLKDSFPLLHITLPLAISFFTFQQIAYLVDSYHGKTAEYDFINYGLFVTFFPQLIAGPIVHHAEMMPQFTSRWNLVKNYKNIATGLFIFSVGLFKKVVLADTFAQWASSGFDQAPVLNFFEAWGVSLSYTFQLYFDFSGYTDMAIGAALLFNIKLPLNFNSPYKALDIQDFWKRWHITLSRFLRDYVYIPLGGSHEGRLKNYTNLMTTFLIAGIWHGAGWTFVFWGFLHGMALVVHRIWKDLGYALPKTLAWFITFNFVNIAWIFFRAEEWKDAVKVLGGMAGLSGVILTEKREQFLSFLSPLEWISFGKVTQHIGDGSSVLNFIIIAFIITLSLNNTMQITQRLPYSGKYTFQFNVQWALVFSLLVFISFLELFFGNTKASEFIYFNF